MTPEEMSPRKRVNICIIFNDLGFHSISERIAKPSLGRAIPMQVQPEEPFSNIFSTEYLKNEALDGKSACIAAHFKIK
jgi:hypothetical protein